MAGDEYMLNFLFAVRLQFQPTNNAEQLNKQLAFIYRFTNDNYKDRQFF